MSYTKSTSATHECFILDAACQKVGKVILDKRLFMLDDSAFESFEKALEANPARGNRCLQKLQVCLKAPQKVMGYYTLSNGSIMHAHVMPRSHAT